VDGVHDLGGLDGFGPVEHKDAEPYFAEAWERRAFRGMISWLATQAPPGGRFPHSIERMSPEHYLSSSYYEHWLTGASTMAVESGFTTPDELERRAGGRFPLSQPDRGVLPDDLTPRTEPRYSVGDDVRVRAWHPPGHTRAPRYVQGKRGNPWSSTWISRRPRLLKPLRLPNGRRCRSLACNRPRPALR
jgi:nitrile hydratase